MTNRLLEQARELLSARSRDDSIWLRQVQEWLAAYAAREKEKQMDKWFPIQKDRRCSTPGEIPWFIAEAAYKQYAKDYGTKQTLERLAERGGFGWEELLILLQGGFEAKKGADNA